MSGLTFDRSGGNDIVKQATPELLNDGTPACGWDSYGQLWVRVNDRDDEPKAWSGRIVGDPRAKICPICQRGWENTVASIGNQEYIHSMERWAHRTCMNGYGHMSNFNFWHSVVCDVERDRSNPSLKFEEVPNKYGSSWTGPWYKVTYAALPSHPFVVGARKRVFQLEMHGVPKELAELLDFSFKAEEVTKGFDAQEGYWYIHAWGRDIATKYFNTLYSMANNWQTELARRAEPKVEA